MVNLDHSLFRSFSVPFDFILDCLRFALLSPFFHLDLLADGRPRSQRRIGLIKTLGERVNRSSRRMGTPTELGGPKKGWGAASPPTLDHQFGVGPGPSPAKTKDAGSRVADDLIINACQELGGRLSRMCLGGLITWHERYPVTHRIARLPDV
jgi:hypothetical protein